MPLYRYGCECGNQWEQRAGYEDGALLCRCGKWAKRAQVYAEQHMIAETGPKGGRKNETPREEKSYRREFKEFTEASQEVAHAYEKAEATPPNYYKEGVRRARKQGAKVRA